MNKAWALILIFFLHGTVLFAQLAPGDLHKAHAFLEGIENCTQCHSQGKKLESANCLKCHKLLKEQISRNAGLHANAEYKNCVDCHVDHLGREYQMVYWGKDGQTSFDHSKTGYILEGAHSKISCEQCHKSANISDPLKFKDTGKDLNKTFLGLSKNCTGCHRDEHRSQLGNDCLKCHTVNNWLDKPGFNHNNTGFILSGKHQSVSCLQCHKSVRDKIYPDDPTYLSYTIKNFNSCQSCHTDVHKNRFGTNCVKCHTTSDWQDYNTRNFDHSKTLYPLRGKHVFLKCNQCHKDGKPIKITSYQKCMDCHSDFHQGQFINRKQKGACEECHTVQGFSPSGFTLEMHQQCAYPLEGSHLAVPCLDCHKTKISAAHKSVIPFKFKDTRCINCHSDPHNGETISDSDQKSCSSCHSVESWRKVNFNHDKTKFALLGKHARTNCIKCHQSQISNQVKWLFKNVSQKCFACHTDVHQGQFSAAGDETDCSRCHSPVDWLADRFDHEKNSAFSLKGAHQYVACQKCHKSTEKTGQAFIVYKPMDKRCESCHIN